MQSPHKLDVDGFETVTQSAEVQAMIYDDLRVAGRLDEIEASMNAVIKKLRTVNPVLLLEESIETGFNIVDDGLPATQFMVSYCLLYDQD